MWGGCDVKACAEHGGSFFHTTKSKRSVVFLCIEERKTLAFVLNDHRDGLIIHVKRERCLVGLGVFDDIVKGFLGDAKELVSLIIGEGVMPLYRERNIEVVLFFEGEEVLFEDGGEVVFGLGGGAKLKDQGAHLL